MTDTPLSDHCDVTQARVLMVLSERASTYPDDSRAMTWEEIVVDIGGDLVRDKRRVVGLLTAAARKGLCWRTPGPGTGRWINGGASDERQASPYKRYRDDGWPYCPQCDEDELYSLAVPATIGTIVSCYRCGWRPGASPREQR